MVIVTHTGPGDAWFETEVEAITTGLLERTGRVYGPTGRQQLSAVVRHLSQHEDTFTVADLCDLLLCPSAAERETAEVRVLTRRLRMRGETAESDDPPSKEMNHTPDESAESDTT